jgi:hypothetical protein
MSIEKKISEWKIIKWGFNGNTWIWAHMFEGMILAWIMMTFDHFFIPDFFTGNLLLSFGTFLFIAMLWDYILEPIIERAKYGAKWKEKIYGSEERWFYDSVGDVIGFVIIGLAVIS